MTETKEKLTPEQLKAELAQFYGTENYYRHQRGIILTDGAKYLAEAAGAYWLMDVIWSYQGKMKSEDFQTWELKKYDPKLSGQVRPVAAITCTDGNDKVLAFQEIFYTDFPLDQIQLYAAAHYDPNGRRELVIMLPSEY